jgi:signal transduction histidine kinase
LLIEPIYLTRQMQNRNRAFFLLSFLMCISYSVVAQRQIDSLKNELKKPLSDSLKLKTLIKLSEAYQYVDYFTAVKLAEEASKMASQKKSNWALSIVYTQKSYLSSINGDFISAIKFDQELLKLAIATKDSTLWADCLNFLGFDYHALGELDEAYYYHSQTLSISKAIKDPAKTARAYINLASIFKDLAQYNKALNYLDLAKRINEQGTISSVEVYILDETGDIYLRQNELVKAEEILLGALKLTKEQKAFMLEPDLFQKLGELSLKQAKFENAKSYYDSAAKIYSKSSNSFGLLQIKLGLAKIYLQQEKLDSAWTLAEESRKIAGIIHAKKAEGDCLILLSDLAERKKDFHKALLYFKSAKAVNDSLVSSGTLMRAFQNQLSFETEKKDSEIAELTSFKDQQLRALEQEELVRNILVVAIALTGVVLLAVYRSGQRRLKINKLLLEHQEEIEQRTVELEQLNKVKDKFFSIISHDLRSPINSLSAILSLMENKNITTDESNRLAKELRLQFSSTKTLINNLLDWALMQMDKLKIQPEKISLHHLAYENYTLVSSLHVKEIQFINEIDKTHFAFADSNMMNLIFRNLIMNALKFTETGGTVVCSSLDIESHYEICISDNGVGMSEDVRNTIFEKMIGYSTRGTANEKGTGLGLILCKEFVERNGGEIRVESELGKGSKFYFTVLKPPMS